MDDRLFRSRSDRVISGVAGGLAVRLDLDPSLVRVAWVILAIVSGGLFLLVYIVMAFVVPEEPFDAPLPGQPGYDPWSSPAATGIRPQAPAEPATPAEFGPAIGPGILTEPASTEPEDATVRFAAPAVPAAAAVASASTEATSGPDAQPATWIGPNGRAVPSAPNVQRRSDRGGGALVFGVILILVGAFFLIRQYAPDIDLGFAWPALAVGLGILLVVLAFIPGRSGPR
jgi:phage shock protein C